MMVDIESQNSTSMIAAREEAARRAKRGTYVLQIYIFIINLLFIFFCEWLEMEHPGSAARQMQRKKETDAALINQGDYRMTNSWFDTADQWNVLLKPEPT